jgi:hypothetical protein
MAEVVEEFVTEAFAFVCAGDKTRDVEEFDRDGAAASDAGAVVGFAAVREVVALAGAVDLEVAYCALWVDGCEAIVETCSGLSHLERVMWRGSAYGKLPAHKSAPLLHGRGGRGRGLTNFGACVC